MRRERTRLQKEEDAPSEADLDTALLVLWHSMGDMHVGQQYLRECRARQKKRRCPERHVSLSPHASARRPPAPECPQSWYRALENRWNSWSVDDEIGALVTVGTRERRSSRAKSFVEGARLETYLRRQNQKVLPLEGLLCCVCTQQLWSLSPTLPEKRQRASDESDGDGRTTGCADGRNAEASCGGASKLGLA